MFGKKQLFPAIICSIAFFLILLPCGSHAASAPDISLYTISPEEFPYWQPDIALYNQLEFQYNEGFLLMKGKRKNNHLGFLGNVRTGLQLGPFYQATPFSEGLAAVCTAYQQYGYINYNGDFVIPPQYREAEPFQNGYAKVEGMDGWFLIDKTGKKVSETYDLINLYPPFGYGVYKENPEKSESPIYQYGLFPYDGTPITPEIYDDTTYANNNHYGLFSYDGTPIIPAKYEFIIHVNDNYFLAESGETGYLMELDGTSILHTYPLDISDKHIEQVQDGMILFSNAKYKDTDFLTVTDFSGNVLLQTEEKPNSEHQSGKILANGNLLHISSAGLGDTHTCTSTIYKRNSEPIVIEKTTLSYYHDHLIAYPENRSGNVEEIPWGNYAIYDMDGNLVMGEKEEDCYLVTGDYIYGVTDNITTMYDWNFQKIASADFSVTSHLRNHEEMKTVRALVFEKDGLYGLCDTALQVLIPASYPELYALWENQQQCLFNAGIEGKKLFVAYDKNEQLPALIEEFYPITEQIKLQDFILQIGNPMADIVNQGSCYIDPDNPAVVPILENDRTLLPMRFITEQIKGAEVFWDQECRDATFTIPGRTIIISPDAYTVTVNTYNVQTHTLDRNTVQLDVPARIIHDRTYVPLRAVVELLQLSVDYDGDTGKIYISSK